MAQGNYKNLAGYGLAQDCTHIITACGDRYERDHDTERLHINGSSARQLMLFGPTIFGTHIAVPSSPEGNQTPRIVLAMRGANGTVECVAM